MAKDSKLFYHSWKNKSALEKRYIQSLEKALNWITSQSFIKEVIAIYVKGSFVFREINEKSDIDLVVICKDNKVLMKIKRIRDLNKEELKPIDILPMSLEELKINERYTPNGVKAGFAGKPDYFLHLIPYHQLVYGKPLNVGEFKIRSAKKILSVITKSMSNFIKMYERKELGFSQLIKQPIHIIYWEEWNKGNIFPPSWKAIKKACPKNKLIKGLFHYRYHYTKDETVRKNIIQEIKKYFKI